MTRFARFRAVAVLAAVATVAAACGGGGGGSSSGGKQPRTGALTEFPASRGSAPDEITVGPDHAMWFTEFGGNRIGRVTPS